MELGPSELLQIELPGKILESLRGSFLSEFFDLWFLKLQWEPWAMELHQVVGRKDSDNPSDPRPKLAGAYTLIDCNITFGR